MDLADALGGSDQQKLSSGMWPTAPAGPAGPGGQPSGPGMWPSAPSGPGHPAGPGMWPGAPAGPGGQTSGPGMWPGAPSGPGGQPSGPGMWPGAPAGPGGPGGQPSGPGMWPSAPSGPGHPAGPGMWPGAPSGPGGQPSGPGMWPGAPSGPGHPAGPGMGPSPTPSGPVAQKDLSVPYQQKIPGGVRDNLRIIIEGVINPGANMITVDLGTDRDLAFHFNPRFNEGGRQVIVRNSCIQKKWGREERELRSFPFARGRRFEMEIHCSSSKFSVSVDRCPLLEYHHRITKLSDIQKLSIHRDLTLTKVELR